MIKNCVLLSLVLVGLAVAKPPASGPTTPPAPCGLSPMPIDAEMMNDDKPVTAQLGQVVWQVTVETKKATFWHHKCGGVVITKQAVLTAASCLEGVWSGMSRAQSGLVELPKGWFVKKGPFPGAQEPGMAYVESVKVHPNFDKKTLANNLAVMRLATGFDFAKSDGNISNICMPEAFASSMDDDEPMFISGWGAGFRETDAELRKQLQIRRAKIVDCPKTGTYNKNEFCVSQHDDEDDDDESMEMMEETTPETPVTTMQPAEPMCEGDIGGALFTAPSGVNGARLIGIASRGGVENCTEHNPTVFLDIFPYLQWINEASKPYV